MIAEHPAGAESQRVATIQENTLSAYTFLHRRPKGRFPSRLAKTPISLMKIPVNLGDAFCGATSAPLIEAAKLLLE